MTSLAVAHRCARIVPTRFFSSSVDVGDGNVGSRSRREESLVSGNCNELVDGSTEKAIEGAEAPHCIRFGVLSDVLRERSDGTSGTGVPGGRPTVVRWEKNSAMGSGLSLEHAKGPIPMTYKIYLFIQ